MRRLKRYIRACGAHRNYKKLLGSCRSRKERLSVLRAELEALGMKGEAGCTLGAAERGSWLPRREDHELLLLQVTLP